MLTCEDGLPPNSVCGLKKSAGRKKVVLQVWRIILQGNNSCTTNAAQNDFGRHFPQKLKIFLELLNIF